MAALVPFIDREAQMLAEEAKEAEAAVKKTTPADIKRTTARYVCSTTGHIVWMAY